MTAPHRIPSLLDEVAALERQHACLVATIEASTSLGCYHVFGASAEAQLVEVEYRIDRAMFAMLALDVPLETH